jgi:uncharacterized membrane protein
MQINRGIGFMLVAVIFMIIAVYKATDDRGGSAVWIALGAAFIALGAAQLKKGKDGDNAG